MNRITADELRQLSETLHPILDIELATALDRAAFTIEEMDKDIAVFESDFKYGEGWGEGI